jgi:phage-related minor tail protein
LLSFRAREDALMDDLQAIKEDYKRREEALQAEIAGLNLRFGDAKETIRINQEMTAKLVTQRVSLDAELGKMKQRFEQESQQWDAKYAQEQEARRDEMKRAHQEILQFQARAEAATAEAEASKASLLEQLARKEKQKLAAVAAVKEELK